MSSIPSPVFPEQLIALEVSIPITSSICLLVLSRWVCRDLNYFLEMIFFTSMVVPTGTVDLVTTIQYLLILLLISWMFMFFCQIHHGFTFSFSNFICECSTYTYAIFMNMKHYLGCFLLFFVKYTL